ncbi:MAG TPA: hypothetical protein VM511_04275, partial [Luteolibacter sp.]|nr:hypothetical protein [Luteolibacter sp.]
MKTMFWILMAVSALAFARGQEIIPGEGIVILPADKLPKTVPLFHSVTADVLAKIGPEKVTTTQKLVFTVHQGNSGELGVELRGAGDVVSVTGGNVAAWSVRSDEAGKRSILFQPKEIKAGTPYAIEVTTTANVSDGSAPVILPGPGKSTGFSMTLAVEAAPGFAVKVKSAEGLVPIDGSEGKRFFSAATALLEMSVAAEGPGAGGIEIVEPLLTGTLSPDGASVSFKLEAKARASAAGSRIALLGGNAAVSSGTSGEGWNLSLEKQGDTLVHQLIAQRAGEFPLGIGFEAPLTRNGDWRSLDFRVPGGVIVPVVIRGLPEGFAFDRSLPVVPTKESDTWRGYLPADGGLKLAWRVSDAIEDGALFFSSAEASDVRVGNGLLRQSTSIQLRILQGKLPSLSIGIDGPGEILSVTGEPGLGWSVKEAEGKRTLEISLSRPIEGGGKFQIESQSALGGFPVKAKAMRFLPAGTLRHSGWLRVANEGAVRIEVADAQGLIQLAPSQFPGKADETLRQVFVYRFPSAEYAYSVQADQVLPETSVTEVTVYELAETDRRIHSDVELDIREAPLREWEMIVPADYAVASVTGASVVDYVVASEVKAGGKSLRVSFKEPVSGRQLVSVRLEKNETAKAGAWSLPRLAFPDAKSRRGYIGASGVAGYRLAAGATSGVAEVPLTFFPKKVSALQQAFRLKETAWKVDLNVEALGQSIQADVFHLYSLKEGAVYG